MMSSVLDSAEYLMLIFQKITIWSSLVGPQGSWALVQRTICTTCMAATDYEDAYNIAFACFGRADVSYTRKL